MSAAIRPPGPPAGQAMAESTALGHEQSVHLKSVPLKSVRLNSPFDLDLDGLGQLLEGQPGYRSTQVWQALHAGRRPAEMTDLPGALRAHLQAALPAGLTEAARSVADGGQTVKWLWTVAGGAQVETVLMHYPGRSTACVSSQAGCAMACQFCATGQGGFARQLSAGEIVEQVVAAQREAASSGRRLTNVVFMGMGEPLANYGPLWAALHRLHEVLGISARHLTVSTVGVVPGIRRMAGEHLPVNLAVSLHAANDRLRDRLVPINRRYPLDALMAACQEYRAAKGRRISFEWAAIGGVNDSRRDATELAALALPLGAHVNLIPLNPTRGGLEGGLRASPPAAVRQFRQRLLDLGVNATVRRNRGTDIDAACGQLAGSHRPATQPVAFASKPAG